MRWKRAIWSRICFSIRLWHAGGPIWREPLPYEDASFDGVVCVEVLEHIDGHERLFREVERVLKPGGVFLFTTPNVMSIKSRLSFLWTGFEHSFYPLEVGTQTPQEWHISGYGGNRYRFVLGLAGLELREWRAIGCRGRRSCLPGWRR